MVFARPRPLVLHGHTIPEWAFSVRIIFSSHPKRVFFFVCVCVNGAFYIELVVTHRFSCFSLPSLSFPHAVVRVVGCSVKHKNPSNIYSVVFFFKVGSSLFPLGKRIILGVPSMIYLRTQKPAYNPVLTHFHPILKAFFVALVALSCVSCPRLLHGR